MKHTDAEHAIAKILAQLEEETGEWVEWVYVTSIEDTSIDDTHHHCMRRVEIKTHPRPGANWETGEKP